jgi:hypothetical protein
MAKQVHLKSRQFFDLAPAVVSDTGSTKGAADLRFVKCRISKEQYRQILIDKGIIKE